MKLGALVGAQLVAPVQAESRTKWCWADGGRGTIVSLTHRMGEPPESLFDFATSGTGRLVVGHDRPFQYDRVPNPYRWRLAAGFLWWSSIQELGGARHRTSLERVPLLGEDALGAPPIRPGKGESYGEIEPLFYKAVVKPPNRIGPYHDILPVGPERVWLWLLADEELSLWDCQLRALPKAAASIRESGWIPRARFEPPFAEPFHVAAAERVWFFVTVAGAVYAAEEAEGRWKGRTLWKDAARPVIAMLVESDGTTAFVFGKDFYLTLSRDTQPRACRDVTQGRNDLGEPMRTVYECARVLHEKGELKAPAQRE